MRPCQVLAQPSPTESRASTSDSSRAATLVQLARAIETTTARRSPRRRRRVPGALVVAPSSSFGSLAGFASSPDGRWIAAGDADGCCRLFDADVAGAGVPMAVADAAPGVCIRRLRGPRGRTASPSPPAGGGRPLRLVAKTDARRRAGAAAADAPGRRPAWLSRGRGRRGSKPCGPPPGFAAEDKPRPPLPPPRRGRTSVRACWEGSAWRRAHANARRRSTTRGGNEEPPRTRARIGTGASASAAAGGWGVGAQASNASSPCAATSFRPNRRVRDRRARANASSSTAESVGAAAGGGERTARVVGLPADTRNRRRGSGSGAGSLGRPRRLRVRSVRRGSTSFWRRADSYGVRARGRGFLSGARIPPGRSTGIDIEKRAMRPVGCRRGIGASHDTDVWWSDTGVRGVCAAAYIY